MPVPTGRAIESFCIAYCAAHGIGWTNISADTARGVRAGVAAGLMSMRGEAEPIGTAIALQTMEDASRDLRAIALEIAQDAPGTAERHIQALHRIALAIDALRASTKPQDAEAI